MKMCVAGCVVAALVSSTSARAETLGSVGKGPTEPYRASRSSTCFESNSCIVRFPTVPKNKILIVETVGCEYVAVPGAKSVVFVANDSASNVYAYVPPSSEPGVNTMTGAYVPFRAGDKPALFLRGQAGQSATCAIAGRQLPAE